LLVKIGDGSTGLSAEKISIVAFELIMAKEIGSRQGKQYCQIRYLHGAACCIAEYDRSKSGTMQPFTKLGIYNLQQAYTGSEPHFRHTRVP
jgi:hypothetical protein